MIVNNNSLATTEEMQLSIDKIIGLRETLRKRDQEESGHHLEV